MFKRLSTYMSRLPGLTMENRLDLAAKDELEKLAQRRGELDPNPLLAKEEKRMLRGVSSWLSEMNTDKLQPSCVV